MLRASLQQLLQRLAFVLLSLSLVGYMGYLLFDLYRSRNELQVFQREQMLRESNRRAQALEYFFSERKQDMLDLAANRELQIYFENKSLGMSFQYGLAASQYEAVGSFAAFRAKSRLGDAEIYTRVVFVDGEGNKLVDVGAAGNSSKRPERDERPEWTSLLARGDGPPSLNVMGGDLVLTVPYRFKSQLSGHLLAWLSIREIYLHFVGVDDPSKRATALVSCCDLLFLPEKPESLLPRDAVPPVASLQSNDQLHFTARARGGRPLQMLAVRTPIPGTSLALVTFLSAAELHDVSPRILIAITGSIGILILFGGLMSVRAQRRAFLAMKQLLWLEAQLRQSQKLEAVGQLAAGIAHEINTPAQFVSDSVHFLEGGFVEVLQLLARYRRALGQIASEHGALAEELRQAEEEADLEYVEANAPTSFRRALDGISRIASIVGALKEFAHPDRREKSPADLNRALQNTLTIAQAEYKNLAEVGTELSELPPVMCHLGEMNQVFLNLLVNAAHAISDAVGDSGAKGKIRVRTAQEGNQVRIEIEDTGCGIPENIRDRVFDPFFTTKEVGRGSGQGLAIARSVVVDKHGGSLTFQSVVGKGTTFTIQLPIGRSS